MKKFPIAWLSGMLLAITASAYAVEIAPSTIVITSREQTEKVVITERGRPVPASSIGSVQFLVDNHNYIHMIEVDRVAGGIVVRPTKDLEIGTYELRVTVGSSRVSATVLATLVHDPDSIQSRAAALGITADELRRQMGLYTTGRQSMQLDFAEWYPVGRRVRIEIPAPERARYEWRLNGESIDSGYGPHVFEYTLRRPGPHRFEYIETDPGGATVRTEAVTTVGEPETRLVNLAAKQSVHLLGPEGFTEYTWLIDGEIVSDGMDLTQSFSRPGEYRVECIASGHVTAEDVAFEKATYRIVVR